MIQVRRRSGSRLSTAQEDALLHQRQQRTQELAVLVAVEFTSGRFRVGGVAAQAKARCGRGAREASKAPTKADSEDEHRG